MPDAATSMFDRALIPEVRSSLEEANNLLARSRSIPDDVAKLVQRLSETVDQTSSAQVAGVDPYLALAFQRGLIGALRALDLKPASERRAPLRVSIERMRQALRDMEEGLHVSEDESTKPIVQWLAAVLDVSTSRMAALLEVHPRTLQRWISQQDQASPHGEEARRVRVIARVANHLRHAFTGPGVVRWLERPHPALDERSPIEVLRDDHDAERLVNLAAAARSSSAS